MDRITENYDSKFRFVLLAAQRAEQLICGAQPRTDRKTPKVAMTAMTELIEGRVEWGYGPAPEGFGEESQAEPEAAEATEES